jgi:hypothetical protein
LWVLGLTGRGAQGRNLSETPPWQYGTGGETLPAEPVLAQARFDPERPRDGRSAPGWDGPLEREVWMPRLRDIAARLTAMAQRTFGANLLEPQVRAGVLALARSANAKLDDIERIYRKFDDFKVPVLPTEVGREFSRWGRGVREGGITLRDGIPQIARWMTIIEGPLAQMDPGAALAMLGRLQTRFAEFNTGGWPSGRAQGDFSPVTKLQFLKDVLAAQRGARAKIADLFEQAGRELWCAQYGVAQSQSLQANRGTAAGALGFSAGAGALPVSPGGVGTGAGLSSGQPPGGEPGAVGEEEFDWPEPDEVPEDAPEATEDDGEDGYVPGSLVPPPTVPPVHPPIPVPPPPEPVATAAAESAAGGITLGTGLVVGGTVAIGAGLIAYGAYLRAASRVPGAA